MKIYLTIASTTISIKISTSYIRQSWTRKHIVFESDLGRGSKTRQHPLFKSIFFTIFLSQIQTMAPKDCFYIHCFYLPILMIFEIYSIIFVKINGYLHLDLQKVIVKKRLPKIQYTHNGETNNYYITSGIFISPWAKSIVHDNSELIHGFI